MFKTQNNLKTIKQKILQQHQNKLEKNKIATGSFKNK